MDQRRFIEETYKAKIYIVANAMYMDEVTMRKDGELFYCRLPIMP